ncbi:hypothetical protein D3C72_1946290 [compost metagenome]
MAADLLGFPDGSGGDCVVDCRRFKRIANRDYRQRPAVFDDPAGLNLRVVKSLTYRRLQTRQPDDDHDCADRRAQPDLMAAAFA